MSYFFTGGWCSIFSVSFTVLFFVLFFNNWLYSDIKNVPSLSFLCPRTWPRIQCCTEWSCLLSLSKLWQILIQFLFVTASAFLKSTGQVFCRMFLSLGVSDWIRCMYFLKKGFSSLGSFRFAEKSSWKERPLPRAPFHPSRKHFHVKKKKI